MGPTILSPTAHPISLTQWAGLVEAYKAMLPSAADATGKRIAYFDLWTSASPEGGHTRSFGSCLQFSQLWTGLVPTRAINLSPESITLKAAVFPTDTIESSFGKEITCSNASVVLRILSGLEAALSPPAGSPVLSSHFQCGGHKWSVVTCPPVPASGQLSDVVLCVDCNVSTACSAGYWDSGQSSVASTNSASGSVYTGDVASVPLLMACSHALVLNALIVVDVTFSPRSPPPSLVGMSVTSATASSVVVRAQLSGPGQLLCGAFVASEMYSPPTTARLALEAEAITVSALGGWTNHTLDKLLPSTKYDIYCATRSTSLVNMEDSATLRTKLTTTTACCRHVLVALSRVDFVDTRDSVDAMVVDLGLLLPASWLLVNISVVAAADEADVDAVRTHPFSPPYVEVRPSGEALQPFSFTFLGNKLTEGRYVVRVDLFGPAASAYAVSFSARGKTIRVDGRNLRRRSFEVQCLLLMEAAWR